MNSIGRGSGDLESEIARILQSSLEDLRDNRMEVSAILQKYAHLREELQPELEVAVRLATTQKMFEPRHGFVEASRLRLVERIRNRPTGAGLLGRLNPL